MMSGAMEVDTLVLGISQLATAKGPDAKHGSAMSEVTCVENAAMGIAGGRFAWIGSANDWRGRAKATVNLGGCAVAPGLVDPHTHAVWAGDRLADFALRTAGASYEQILAAGGGIRSTIKATQKASQKQLVALALPRLLALIASGATVVEVKSGYGFTVDGEIRMLEVIRQLQAILPARLVPTLLIHIPPAEAGERSNYLGQVTGELIPEVARRKLAVAVDVFVEREAWRADEAETILSCTLAHGLGIRVHTEQFHSIGGLELAVQLGALSADHLEACRAEQDCLLAGSRTIATLLPGVSLHLGIPRAPGRRLIDAGAAVAVGTDLNPGSSPLFSTSAALALSVRLNGLTAEEALVAGTVNAARALGMNDAGRIEPGLAADFAVLHGADWRDLVYLLGTHAVRETWIAGKKIDAGARELIHAEEWPK